MIGTANGQGAGMRLRGSRVIEAASALAILLAAAPVHGQSGSAPGGTRVGAAYVQGEVIVKLKGKARATKSQAFIGKAVSEQSMKLKGSWSSLNMHRFGLRAGTTVEGTVAQMQADPAVEYAEPNYILTKQSLGLEGQPISDEEMMSASQAAAGAPAGPGTVQASSAPSYSQSNAPIDVPQAWSQMSASRPIPIVAVIDTGIDLHGRVFVNSGAIWTNAGEIPSNGADDDGNGYVDDVHGWNFAYGNNSPQDDDGHGTHVSGIVLGITQDITQTTLAPAKIRIMPLKFLDSTGSGSTSDAVEAIYYAANNGARILNNSWGGSGFSSALLDAISYAYSQHCLFVAAAGNASSNNDSSPTYPANYDVPGLISVAATSDSDALANFSNYGASTVHLGGPGVSILSTLQNNTWGYESGTSMATPMISGVAALMAREQTSMYGYQIKQIMFSGNQSVQSLVNRTTTQGRVNAYNSILAAKAASASGSQPGYDPSAVERSMASAPDSAAAIGGCGMVSSRLRGDGSDGGDGMGTGAGALLGVILLAPLALSLGLRLKAKSGRELRKHERFQIASQVRLTVGDRELTGSVSSISLGGAQVNADAWLENGGIVSMKIASPDGRDEIEVQGRVVWSEENKRYGVAFSESTSDGALASIQRWTASLVKG